MIWIHYQSLAEQVVLIVAVLLVFYIAARVSAMASRSESRWQRLSSERDFLRSVSNEQNKQICEMSQRAVDATCRITELEAGLRLTNQVNEDCNRQLATDDANGVEWEEEEPEEEGGEIPVYLLPIFQDGPARGLAVCISRPREEPGSWELALLNFSDVVPLAQLPDTDPQVIDKLKSLGKELFAVITKFDEKVGKHGQSQG